MELTDSCGTDGVWGLKWIVPCVELACLTRHEGSHTLLYGVIMISDFEAKSPRIEYVLKRYIHRVLGVNGPLILAYLFFYVLS